MHLVQRIKEFVCRCLLAVLPDYRSDSQARAHSRLHRDWQVSTATLKLPPDIREAQHDVHSGLESLSHLGVGLYHIRAAARQSRRLIRHTTRRSKRPDSSKK